MGESRRRRFSVRWSDDELTRYAVTPADDRGGPSLFAEFIQPQTSLTLREKRSLQCGLQGVTSSLGCRGRINDWSGWQSPVAASADAIRRPWSMSGSRLQR